MKNYLGFVLGVVSGCAGLLLAQQFTKSGADANPAEPESGSSLVVKRQEKQLADARKRITELEEEVAEAKAVATAEVAPAGDAGIESSEEADAKGSELGSFLELMASMGDSGEKRKIEKEVDRLAAVLGLSENQQTVLHDALSKKAADQKAAGLKLLTGKATLDDLLASDENNFVAVDAALMEVLDQDQLELYENELAEREVKRIQSKFDEELGRFAEAADLTDEQQDAAWEVLSPIIASEKPGDLPEGTTSEEFIEYVDVAIDQRLQGLAPILNDDQMELYSTQSEEFRKMVTGLVGLTSKNTPE